MRRRRVLSVLLSVLFSFLAIMISLPETKNWGIVVFGEELGLREHSPILFVGNTGFSSYNGVANPTAKGTKEDPFIIEQWRITYSGAEQYSVYIGDTDAYFVIRNVLIENGRCGICLFQVTNARIENVVAQNCSDGIQLLYVSSSTVMSCRLASNSRYGLDVINSENVTVTHNTIVQNSEGIVLYDCTNNTVFDNYFENYQSDATDFGTNDWNSTMQPGKNIIGGTHLGGNYFHNYSGEDLNKDGIGDTPYNVRYGPSKDYLPLFNQPPEAGFVYTPSNITIVDVVEFSDYSSDPENRISSWLWFFGDGTNSTVKNATHKYASPGDYSISLWVTDSLGKSGTCNAAVKVYPAQILFTICISRLNVQPQIKKLKVSFSMSWVSEPEKSLWLTVRDNMEDTSFLLSEYAETLIPIDVGGEFPNDFYNAHFHISIAANYTIQFNPILAESLQGEYEVMPWAFASTNEAPSAKLGLIPHLYHYDVKIELVRPGWFKIRWNLLTWLPIAIITTLILVSNMLISSKDLREHITIYVSITFFSLGFVTSILQFLPPTFLLVESLLPGMVILATVMLAMNMLASRKGIDSPIFIYIWQRLETRQEQHQRPQVTAAGHEN